MVRGNKPFTFTAEDADAAWRYLDRSAKKHNTFQEYLLLLYMV